MKTDSKSKFVLLADGVDGLGSLRDFDASLMRVFEQNRPARQELLRRAAKGDDLNYNNGK